MIERGCAVTAPTSTKGYVDPYLIGSDFNSIYLDLLEHIPDLTFPLSVQVYARMRRDPQLTAILQGWTLQLRRCQWQLDPAGCRPEVVQLCADGAGLNVAGKDKPSAARLHGVSWNDHLAAALRMLTFGFAGFEMQADTSDGKTAKLSGLWERPQWTISHIHADGKTGLLTGITQDAAWKQESPQITADRLVWYVNDREGANWAGTGLLRPAYASWLIKEEMRRVHGIANKRWGAGVPVMEALPGTSPTPAQMAEAMQMAAAAQSGMQAGAASPPGFQLKLMGLTGSVPDTLSFMKWLDQQMSRAALMGVIDLGDTSNGSRALGETFVDSFLLALESCAEAIADTATRQICARLVDWNHGADEPVPRVVASGVGSRREVTAESLNLLLSSGALAADPGLEAWVRREYRLPERTEQDDPPVKAPGVDLGNNQGVDDAGRQPRPVAAKAGQMSLFDSPVAAAAGHGLNHFDPGQKRDQDGKWARTGAAGKAKAAVSSPGETAAWRPLKVRPRLAKAKTLADIGAAADAEVARIRGPRGRKIQFSFESENTELGDYRAMDTKTAREHAEGILRVLEAFPHAGLTRVRAAHSVEDEGLKGAYAYAHRGELVFNLGPGSPPGRRQYLSLLKADVAAEWSVPNSASPIAVAIHEMGHILDLDTLGGNPGDTAQRLFSEAGTTENVVSGYAMTNRHELTAEAFADVMVNGTAASAMSRKIFDGLVAEYQEREAYEAGREASET